MLDFDSPLLSTPQQIARDAMGIAKQMGGAQN